MCEGKTKWSWSSDNFTSFVILRSVTWAHVLVCGSVPWNNATQMCAHGIQSIVSKTIFINDQVMSITFKTLNQLSVSNLMGCEPIFTLYDITISISGLSSCATTWWGWWNKEVNESTSHPSYWNSSSSKKNQVHNSSSLHIWDKSIISSSCHLSLWASWHTPWHFNDVTLILFDCESRNLSTTSEHLNVICSTNGLCWRGHNLLRVIERRHGCWVGHRHLWNGWSCDLGFWSWFHYSKRVFWGTSLMRWS